MFVDDSLAILLERRNDAMEAAASANAARWQAIFQGQPEATIRALSEAHDQAEAHAMIAVRAYFDARDHSEEQTKEAQP
jgi:hypothetical protein